MTFVRLGRAAAICASLVAVPRIAHVDAPGAASLSFVKDARRPFAEELTAVAVRAEER